jgi:hypothetical protein
MTQGKINALVYTMRFSMLASLLILAKKPEVKLLLALTKRERAADASPICSLNNA